MRYVDYEGEPLDEMDFDDLRDLVVDTVFGMAAGEHGIPAWLREAEAELDRRVAEPEETL